MSLDVSIFGWGAVCQQFYKPSLDVLIERGDVTVRCIVDPNPVCRALGTAAFPEARAFDSHEDVDLPISSLVIVASPPRFHAEQTIYALSKGAHVLCEKPMAVDRAEAMKMIQAAEKADRLLAIGLYKRFFPSHEFVKELCESRVLGRLKSIVVREGGKFVWEAASDSFFSKSATAGGVFYDIGVHVVDLIQWWIGFPLTCRYEDDADNGLESNCWFEGQFRDGVVCDVHISRDVSTINQYELTFEKAVVQLGVNGSNQVAIQMVGCSRRVSGFMEDRYGSSDSVRAITNAQAFVAQLENVVGSIRGDCLPRVPGSEGIKSLSIIQKCYGMRRRRIPAWAEIERRRREACIC